MEPKEKSQGSRKQSAHPWQKRITAAALCLVVLVGAWFVATGWMTRTDVYIYGDPVAENGDTLTVQAGVAGSMGYLRRCAVVAEEAGALKLRFYSTFGGLNSSFGAKSVFTIPLNADTNRILLEDDRVLLVKNEETGRWECPE